MKRSEIAQPASGTTEAFARMVLEPRVSVGGPVLTGDEVIGRSSERHDQQIPCMGESACEPISDDDGIPTLSQKSSEYLLIHNHTHIIAKVKRNTMGRFKIPFHR
jgi:hypothetical protein